MWGHLLFGALRFLLSYLVVLSHLAGSTYLAHFGFYAVRGFFVISGFIMTAVDLLSQNPEPSEVEIRHAIEGNLCRCTGYHNIVKAVQQGAAAMAK